MHVWQIAAQLHDSKTPFAMVTLVTSRGHVPSNLGAKAIVTEQGLFWGTVGGGKLEAKAIALCQEYLERHCSAPLRVSWNLTRDVGMTCGGEIEFLFEFFKPYSWKIAIFGAGHVAQAVVRLLDTLDCEVVCIDPRAEWIEKLPRTPKLEARCVADPASEVKSFGPKTFFVVMTQGHATDLPILSAIFKYFTTPRYVGAIGSDVKALKLRSDLRAQGVSDAALEFFRCPIGLKLGSNDPAEIALSVVAELVQLRGR